MVSLDILIAVIVPVVICIGAAAGSAVDLEKKAEQMTKLSICVATSALWFTPLGSAVGFWNNPFPFQDDCKSEAYAAIPRAPGLKITGTSIKVEKNNLYLISVTAEAGGTSVKYQFLCSWANGNAKIIKRSIIK